MTTPDQRVVHEVETLKALADRTRLTILELVMGNYGRTWTAKELASAVGMPPKKIYYHLNLLEQQRLLTVRATQVVNGIIEKHYGAGQRSISFQRGRTPGGPGSAVAGGTSAEFDEVVSTIFEEVHDNIHAGLKSGAVVMDRQAPDDKRAVVSYTTARMSPARAGEFRDALLAVVKQFRAANSPDQPAFDLLIAIAPRGTEQP